MSQNEALELPREERPFHSSYYKCYHCGDRFKKGDDIFFVDVIPLPRNHDGGYVGKEAICKKCSEDEAWRVRREELNAIK